MKISATARIVHLGGGSQLTRVHHGTAQQRESAGPPFTFSNETSGSQGLIPIHAQKADMIGTAARGEDINSLKKRGQLPATQVRFHTGIFCAAQTQQIKSFES